MSDTLKADKAADGGLRLTACSPSSLTPETDEAWKAVSRTPDGMYDSRVPIKEYAYAMSRHSKKMECARNLANDALKYAAIEIAELRHQIRETIMENLHLADGDDCTLKRLKDAISFELDDSCENISVEASPPEKTL